MSNPISVCKGCSAPIHSFVHASTYDKFFWYQSLKGNSYTLQISKTKIILSRASFSSTWSFLPLPKKEFFEKQKKEA